MTDTHAIGCHVTITMTGKEYDAIVARASDAEAELALVVRVKEQLVTALEKAEAALDKAQYRAYVAGRERDEARGALAEALLMVVTEAHRTDPDAAP